MLMFLHISFDNVYDFTPIIIGIYEDDGYEQLAALAGLVCQVLLFSTHHSAHHVAVLQYSH